MESENSRSRGDASIIEEWMKEYGTMILRCCYIYLKDYALAEDASQDTFIKAYQALARDPAITDERAWLARIAINTCKDYRRSAWTRRIDRSKSPEAAIDRPQFQSAGDSLLDTIMQLAPKYKSLILLHYYQGFTVDETARILSIPVSSAYRRLRSAEKQLKEKLERRVSNE